MKAGRFELVAALVLAATLVALGAAFGRADGADDPRASTFVNSRRGLRALFLVLEEVGQNPRRRLVAPSASDPTDRTLVVAAPSESITRRETAELVAWVRAGGRLVVVDGPPSATSRQPHADPLLEAFGFGRAAAFPAAVRVDDAALAEGLGRLEWPPRWSIEEDATPDGAGPIETLVSAGRAVLVARRAFGEGETVVVADPRLFDDESLGKGDDAVLAVRLLCGRGAVEFDEFHHGFQEGRATDLVGLMAELLVSTWPGRAALVLAFAAGLWLAGAMVRLGSPDPDLPPPRRALSEHAEALGRLFEIARARAEALKILVAGARRATGPRAGVPGALPTAEFARRLRASAAPGAAELADAVERAAAARPTKDVEMASLAANLAEARRRYLHAG